MHNFSFSERQEKVQNKANVRTFFESHLKLEGLETFT